MDAYGHDDYRKPKESGDVGAVKINQPDPYHRVPEQAYRRNSAQQKRNDEKARHRNSKIIKHALVILCRLFPLRGREALIETLAVLGEID